MGLRQAIQLMDTRVHFRAALGFMAAGACQKQFQKLSPVSETKNLISGHPRGTRFAFASCLIRGHRENEKR
jgi:hypothetical protein